jgi:hypothetical protein
MSEFKTWSSDVPVRKIVNITKKIQAGPVSLTGIHGSPEGWIKYIADPGAVIDGGAIEDAAIQMKRCSYLILEGLTITGGKLYSVDILRSHNIRLVNCDISGWGRQGKQDFSKKGVYYDEKGGEIDFDNGVNIYKSGNVVVERCYVHDPRGTANSWFYYHPEGTQAVGVMSAGGTVLRYNDFIGGQMNCRFFKNKVEGFLCGISLAPNMLGPSYVYNNLFVNEGDVTNAAGSVFKNGGGSTYTSGTTFFFNNTAYTNGQGLAAVGFGEDKNKGQFNGYSRNNLLACRLIPITDREMNQLCDFDYDLMCNQDRLDNYYLKAATGMGKHGVIALPKFKNTANADFNLSSDSRGIGEGTAISNFVPGTNGKADI